VRHGFSLASGSRDTSGRGRLRRSVHDSQTRVKRRQTGDGPQRDYDARTTRVKLPLAHWR